MSIFNQIAPRLSRALSSAEGNGTATAEAEYTVKPAYATQETPEAWTVTVQLPGVAKDGLEITAEENLLTIRGPRAWQKPEGWTAVYRESVAAPFELTLEHDNAVAVEKIVAELKEGVLRLTLPKAESVKPRKVAVN
jgi:HSP20 family molecular chaperone IbpA